ncbi:MOSC domain-containing protein [Candidatus Bathyarchaeota archaeon]|nr:MOSC domain-containing protein [Candidatus Bathyarchaeota archaeon]
MPYAEITSEGFRFDRQYILIKTPENGPGDLAEHLTIKRLFTLALFQPSIHDNWSRLTIRHTTAQPESSITIPLTPSPLYCAQSISYTVSIFGTVATGIDMGDELAAFFGGHLGLNVRMLFIGGDGCREIPGAAFLASHAAALPSWPGGAAPAQRIRFADAAPFLITTSASEDEARSRLPRSSQSEDVIVRFRPNIHIAVDGDTPPFDEDDWKELAVFSGAGDTRKATIHCIFRTARCLSLNADLKTGRAACRNQQLYGLLAQDRRVNSVFPRKHKPR